MAVEIFSNHIERASLNAHVRKPDTHPNILKISDIDGLQAALDGKLNDTTSQAGAVNISATGNDLNLLTGAFAYGLTGSDLMKLADINVSANEINELSGITGNVQVQLDSRIDSSLFTASGEFILSTGAGTHVATDFASAVTAFTLDQFGSPTVDLDVGGFRILNLGTPVDPNDAATKAYVDGTVGGPFLPLSGGIMAGSIDLAGFQLNLDTQASIDGNTDTIVFTAGTATVTIAPTGFDAGGLEITNIGNATSLTSAVSKGYVDTGLATKADLFGASFNGPVSFNLVPVVTNTNPVNPNEIGNLGFNDSRYLQISNDLSEVNAVNARTNLGLAAVASSGDYNDLINAPTIVSVLNDLGDVSVPPMSAATDGYVLQWSVSSGKFTVAAPAVESVFGRTGNVVGAFGDYSASDISYTGAIPVSNVSLALDSLESGKLPIDGSIGMTGTLNMAGNDIQGVGTLLANTASVATSATVGTTPGSVTLNGAGNATTPSISFDDTVTPAGFYRVGDEIRIAIGSVDRVSFGPSMTDFQTNRITNLGDPVNNQDAVTVNWLKTAGHVFRIGSATGIDLGVTNSSVTLFNAPSDGPYVVSHVIVYITSVVPGANPIGPSFGIGTNAAADDIFNTNLPVTGSVSAGKYYKLEPVSEATILTASAPVFMSTVPSAGTTISSMLVDIHVYGSRL